MALTNTEVRAKYNANGVTVTFAIPFTGVFTGGLTIEQQTKVYSVDETTDPLVPEEILLTEGAMNDYTIVGANVVFNTAPASPLKILVIRQVTFTQPTDLGETEEFPVETVEETMDKIVAMAQELKEMSRRSLKYRITSGEVDKIFPDPQASTVITYDEDGNLITLTFAQLGAYIAIAGGGMPAGGEAFALLEKVSDAEGDGTWTQPLVYQGYSERYSQLVDLEGIKAVADFIMDMGYAPPTVSLGTNPNYATLRERGDEITSVDLTATIGVVLDDIAEVRFYRGATLIDTQTSGGGIPSGGASTYTDADPFETNRTYSVQVDDVSAEAKPSATSSRTFTFVYPYYYGVGAAGLGIAVDTLTKQIINETTSTLRNFTVDGTEKMYFAYPASYGTLSSILDVNSFNTVGDWTLTVANITGLDGNAVSYNIYEFNNFAVAGTYEYTFIQ